LSRNVLRLQGLVVLAVTLVTTLWLALTGQLVLYIHPRYVVFTVIMTLIGLAFVVAVLGRTVRATRHDENGDDHDHDHDEPPVPRSRLRRAMTALSATVVLAVTATLLLLPPATLSSATATQRDINSTTVGANTTTVSDVADAGDGIFAAFTVLDWSSLLRQSSDASFYDGKPVDVVGFITEDPDDAENMFYVSRFVVTCCAVDAQPVGVPVYLENWKNTYSADQWVEATGGFTINPSASSTQSVALLPDTLEVVDQPNEPYLY